MGGVPEPAGRGATSEGARAVKSRASGGEQLDAPASPDPAAFIVPNLAKLLRTDVSFPKSTPAPVRTCQSMSRALHVLVILPGSISSVAAGLLMTRYRNPARTAQDREIGIPQRYCNRGVVLGGFR
jgi:hypothetical protein